MQPGDREPAGRTSPRAWFVLCVGLLAGCASGPQQFDKALMADKGTPPTAAELPYTVACPDLLDVAVAARPDLSGLQEVSPDGCVAVGSAGRVRVEGQPAGDAGRLIAAVAGVPEDAVRVRVAGYHSQQVYLTGQVVGGQ